MKKSKKIVVYLLILIAGILGGIVFDLSSNNFFTDFYGNHFYLIPLPLIIGGLFPITSLRKRETILFISSIFLILGIVLASSYLIVNNQLNFVGLFSFLFGGGIYISEKYIKPRIGKNKSI
jgi:hypothetical protein